MMKHSYRCGVDGPTRAKDEKKHHPRFGPCDCSCHNKPLTLAAEWWVYTHDLNGDIINDYGNFYDRSMAELTVATVLDTAGFDPDTMIVRLVDASDPGNTKTIWIVAPMSYINTLKGND